MNLSRRTKLIIVLVMAFATVLNYLDREALSILAPTLQREMGFDNAHLGQLFAIFYYSYTLFQFVVGPVLDRFNLRWCFAIAVFAWSIVSGLTGLAAGFVSLMIFRFFLGVTQAPNWPAGLRIIARTFPPEERTLGSGIFESGAAVGALVAPAAVFFLLPRFGWPSAFFGLGALGLFWAPIWLFVTRGRNLDQVWLGRRSSTRGINRLLSIYREFAHSRQFWWVLVVSVTVNPCFYFTVNWLPSYLVQVRGLVPGFRLGEMLTLIYLSLDIGNIGGGAVAFWLTRRNLSVETARRVVFLTATALVGICSVVPFLATPWSAVAALVAVNLGLGVWNSMYDTMAQEVSSTHVSTATGTLSGFGSLVGALAMWAVGDATEAAGGFTIVMVGVTVAILLAAFAGWAASQRPANFPLMERAG